MSPTEPPFPASPREGASAVGPGEPYRLLLVCTGNTCRSPLAEALAKAELARRGWRHVDVRSAGVGALPGSPASEGAIRVADRHGLDLSSHRSVLIGEEAVESADLMLTMSPAHLSVLQTFPGAAGKAAMITAFAAGDFPDAVGWHGSVPDPIGLDDAEYEATFQLLKGLMERVMDRLEPLVDP
jgi:protein-tyrosine phosphatase